MSVRERTREVGVLRGLGLRKSHILEIVLGESALAGLLIALLIGLVGAILPAIRASRVRLVEALRVVD